MRALKLAVKGCAVLAAGAAAWCVVFAVTGSALLHPDPSARVAIGRALLAGFFTLLAAPTLLDALPAGASSSFFRKFVIGTAFVAAPYLVALVLTPARYQAMSWFAYGIAASIPAAALAAMLIQPRSRNP